MKEDVLELETRRQIYTAISINPGLHFRELQRHLDISTGLLDYHLKYMEKRELVVSKRDGNYLRYYASNQVPGDMKELFPFLRQEITRTILIYLLLNPEAQHGEILENLTVSGATLSYHLKKMSKAGVIEKRKAGRESRYTVKNPERVGDALATYRRSFTDRLVDSFVRAWTAK